MKKQWIVAGAVALALAGAARAQAPEWISAKVVKVDSERSRVVLDHERIASINMEAMTMPFKADKEARIERFKPGDKVRFTVENKDDHLVVRKMEPAK